jgi:signal transduction histidine kinase
MKSSRLSAIFRVVLVSLLLSNIAGVKAGIAETSAELSPEIEQSVIDNQQTGSSEGYVAIEEVNVRYIYNFITIIIILLGGMTFFAMKQRSQRKKFEEQNLLLALRKKHLENTLEELKEKEQEMRNLNQIQNRILSIIGHDLRGPLGSLYEYFKVYAGEEVELNGGEFRKIMEECSRQMGAVYFLAENLLFWAQNRNSEIKTNPGNWSLKNMATETKELLNLFAMNKGITLNVDIEEDFRAKCDYNQISSVLRNLISNAIKFTNIGGSITLSCKYRKNELMFTVTDTGVGIDQNQLNLLLDRKSSFSTHGTDNEPGTGLGLILISEFVEKNNGKLIGSSCPGQGASFTFSLPVADDYCPQLPDSKSTTTKKELVVG